MAGKIGSWGYSAEQMTPEEVDRPSEVQQRRGPPGVRDATRKGSGCLMLYSRRTRHRLVHDSLEKDALQSGVQGEPRP